jgi:hypothetical protein
MLIQYFEGPASPSEAYRHMVTSNMEQLLALFEGRGPITQKWVTMTSEGRRVGSRQAANIIAGVEEIADFSDIVVDIGALPRSLFLPLLAKLLHLAHHPEPGSPKCPNIHVIVAEDQLLDRSINEVGVDETASTIHGFSGDLEVEATQMIPRVWFPILGEGKITQLERIYEFVKPSEICPVIPSPSSDARRGDNLVAEYREFLFDAHRIEPRNIIYACEHNPFDLYRQLHTSIVHYHHALHTLGGCKAIVSALSSKLLSVGALLACYELKNYQYMVGISHIEAQGYELAGVRAPGDSIFFSLFLAGELYAL